MVCPRCGEETLEGKSCPSCGSFPPDEDVATERGGALGKRSDARPDSLEPEPDVSESPTGFAAAPLEDDQEEESEAPTGLSQSPVRADDEDDETHVFSTSPSTGRAPLARDSGPLEIGQQFGRYHILRLLGLGGMGAVYHAWDKELGVTVALKIVRPEIATNPEASLELEKRFKRELLLARQVTHKNVVRIHDMGEIDGIKYITMPYVDGVELDGIMKRKEGGLPVEQVVSVARGVVSGLLAAHHAGVVHRDLKPANIMIDSETGEALIMDFGIARSTGPGAGMDAEGSRRKQEPQGPIAAGLTMAGSVVGTLEYMAPEQARGEDVDQRADLYALGLILYDMLAGGRRAKGHEGALRELRERMAKAPPSLKESRPDLPAPLEQIISRLVEPDREERYHSTTELAADLAKLDERGRPLPITRRLSLWQVAVLLGLVVATLVSVWWMASPPEPAVRPDPVSVLIADFENRTGDPAFDRTLEPMLKMALEDAEFITAYGRPEIRRGLGVRPPERLDDGAARQLAINQGLGVVLSGAVERDGGDDYRISVTAAQAVTGDVIASAEAVASDQDRVLGVTTELATEIRDALGDDTSDSAQRFAMETLSATSLQVVREYAAAMEALSDSRFEAAHDRFSKAVELDPDFGLAYAGMAIASRNLDRQQDAEKYVEEAVRHLDGMTERERYRTRGLFYMVTGDHQACVKEYRDLIARYSADAAARNNLALCSTYLRDLPTALQEMRRAVEILPNRALYKENLALYASYAGDFQTAEEVARAMEDPGLFGVLALAFAQVGQRELARAAETYEQLGNFGDQGASYAASGLGDLALFEGRLSEAAQIFERGAAEDLSSGDVYRAAAKLAALAYTELLRERRDAAVTAANDALANSEAVKIRFLAARIFVEAGELEKARALAAELASELQAEPRAYAKIIEGGLALENGAAREAISLLTEANGLLDTWMGHFDLGRAYLEAGAFIQADSELDRCLARRGEALSLFLDEEPTYGHFPHVYYYQGRVREALGSAGFRESYRAYLDIRGRAGEDPLLPDVRRRAESGTPDP